MVNAAAVFAAVFIGLIIFALIGIVLYFLKSTAISDLLGENDCPWRAFAPFFRVYALGQIAFPKKNVFAVIYTAFSVLKTGIWLTVFGMYAYTFVGIVADADRIVSSGGTVTEAVYDPLRALSGWLFFLAAVAVIYRIIALIAEYRVLLRASVARAVIGTVLSVPFRFLEPVFLFSVRRFGADENGRSGGFDIVS